MSSQSSSSFGSSSSDSWSRSTARAHDQHVQRFRELSDAFRAQMSSSAAADDAKDAVDELRKEHESLVRMRDALARMMRVGRNARDLEVEWQENRRALSELERRLERAIGGFRFRVEALDGWARVCAGDVYEIDFRLGAAGKHCARVRVGRDGTRHIEAAEFELSAALVEPLVVRVRELKTSWTRRYVTLGVTHVETRDLMRARPQTMSLLANCSGSLKVRLRVEWTPALAFEAADADPHQSADSWSDTSTTSTLAACDARDAMAARALHALSVLANALQDFQGQYEELEPLSAAVDRLARIVGHSDADVSAALAAFGFLDADSEPRNAHTRATDSAEQWHSALLAHCTDAARQLTAIGAWLLKAREKHALERLVDHAFALDVLGRNGAQDALAIRGHDPRVLQLWSRVTERNDAVIVVTWQQFASACIALMDTGDGSDVERTAAADWLTTKVCDRSDCVTVLHVRAFFERMTSAEATVDDMFDVALHVQRLLVAVGADDDAHAFAQLLTHFSRLTSRVWMPFEVTWSVARAAVSTDYPMAGVALKWFRATTDDNRLEICDHLMCGLESSSSATRLACCRALAALDVHEAIDALLLVSTDDVDVGVREAARRALSAFGAEVEARCVQCALTRIGFTGLSLSPKPPAKVQ